MGPSLWLCPTATIVKRQSSCYSHWPRDEPMVPDVVHMDTKNLHECFYHRTHNIREVDGWIYLLLWCLVGALLLLLAADS